MSVIFAVYEILFSNFLWFLSEDPGSPLASDLANNVMITRRVVTTTAAVVETSANSETVLTRSVTASHGDSA